MAISDAYAPTIEESRRRQVELKHDAIRDLTELVCGPEEGEAPRDIRDPILWVHRAFDAYRAGMPDNDPRIVGLARIEHDFIAALCALNFDDQRRQLRLALERVKRFPASAGAPVTPGRAGESPPEPAGPPPAG